MVFKIGQRWANHADAKLGLGIVSDIDGRKVTISFPAVGESRVYAMDNSPLIRIRYAPGDTVTDMDDRTLTVAEVLESGDLLRYRVINDEEREYVVDELDLNCFIQFTTPLQRFLSGQIDKNSTYSLRVETLSHLDRLQQSPVAGLLGSRTSLLPHQVYIADEISRRHAPRVLLADEVGLGKTIEAGMILHRQIQTGQVERVLILVPENLVHQWLVEMLRRFTLAFSVLDRSRVDALLDSGYDNPFESEQRIICNLEFLVGDTDMQEKAASARWDLVIVDEAHHLHWSEAHPSPEYRCAEKLSANTGGLLLLTATPEQVGLESHFARLKLLDPARFHDLETFKQEAAGYQTLNELLQRLLASEGRLDNGLRQALAAYSERSPEDKLNENELKRITRELLDRHGTGRILFRNTRATIQGFPGRQLHAYPLDAPMHYATPGSVESGLYPEQSADKESWLQTDPRPAWLAAKLKALRPQKVLIICHHSNTAVALDKYLTLNAGIRSSAFHEGLSLLERDRAAAWFTDEDDGAQTLVCSEIGSEGRNFQFAHHLVLFDLPLNPDLLEQRIGRLDRIGQRHTIQIHAPYLRHTAQEVMYHWYHEGINLFERSSAIGYAVYEQFEARLHAQLLAPAKGEALARLARDTAAFTEAALEKLRAGRDRLLELNSCDADRASELISAIEREEKSELLEKYMEQVFDYFGVNHEHHSSHSLVLTPGDHMQAQDFPWLGEEGNTVTFDREKALAREDMQFLTWEHPMVTESMEMIRNTEAGNATIATISIKSLPPASLLLESYFTIDVVAPKALQLQQYLSITPIRILVDVEGRDLARLMPYHKLNVLCGPVNKDSAYAIAGQVRPRIESMLGKARRLAEPRLLSVRNIAKEKATRHLSAEKQRLIALQKLNATIRSDEIEFIETRLIDCLHYLDRADMQLQALRLIINQ